MIVACRKGNRSEPALAGYQHFGGGSDELLLLGATERIGPVFALLHAMAQGRASPPRQISRVGLTSPKPGITAAPLRAALAFPATSLTRRRPSPACEPALATRSQGLAVRSVTKILLGPATHNRNVTPTILITPVALPRRAHPARAGCVAFRRLARPRPLVGCPAPPQKPGAHAIFSAGRH